LLKADKSTEVLKAPCYLVQEVRACGVSKLQYGYKLSSMPPNPNVLNPKKLSQNNPNLRSLQSGGLLVKHPFLTTENCHTVLGSLPLILNGFERACLLNDINSQLFETEVCPEFLLWAISGAGVC
jgi:hypothetical protein